MSTNTNIKDNLFQTSDMALAAAISLYYPIESIDNDNPRHSEFLFVKDDKFDDLISSYWRNELKIAPQIYFNQLRSVKAQLYGRGR